MHAVDNSKLWYTDSTGDIAASRVDRSREKSYRPRKSAATRYEIVSLIRRLESSLAFRGGASA
jgi:hypothetical protein